MEKYGVENLATLPEIQEKARQTKLKKYGRDNVGQFGTKEHNDSIKEKYGVDHISQNEEIKNKIKQTNLKRYGVENVFQLVENQEKSKQAIIDKYGVKSASCVPEIAEKMKEGRKRWRESPEYPEKRKLMTEHSWETRKRNGTCNTSKTENKIFELLKQKFTDVKRQYKSTLYPFRCDFYIPEKNLYIEYQGYWSHGKQPFNESNNEHLNILHTWEKRMRTKDTSYANAIEVWTIRDPLKRQTAKENNLNWLEFFTLKQFMEWYNNLK